MIDSPKLLWRKTFPPRCTPVDQAAAEGKPHITYITFESRSLADRQRAGRKAGGTKMALAFAKRMGL